MAATSVTIRADSDDVGSVVAFGIGELRRALREAGFAVTDSAADVEIALELQPSTLAEAYSISPTGGGIALVGHDETGAMYACLDLAEQIEMGLDLTAVEPKQAQPELAVRGIHTFLHNAESEQEWLHDPNYWRAYADELARCRYNRFNLIYGHQTAYLIPIYAHLLEELDEQFPEIRVTGITRAERRRNLEVLQTASAAMSSRGITFFLGIWQSRPWTVAGGERADQPTRVTGTEDLRVLAAYTRAGFTRLIDRCPHIGGIQLRMNVESGIADQRFFVRSFVPALQELASRGRALKVELRNWALQPDTIEAFRQTGLEIVVSAKYFAEHQGLPYQPPIMRGSYSYDSLLHREKPFPFLWHLWSLGSHRLFAWGDPEYARRFVRSCHLGDGIGFDVTPPGSQKGFSQFGQVYPGDWQIRHDLPRQWDFERYWFFHMAFGRMGYDSNIWFAPFVHELAKRTSPEAAPALLAAYRAASRVVSYLISMRMDDPNMYVWPELDCGGPIDHNSIAGPGEVSLFETARGHAADRVAGRATAKRSPFDVASDLQRLGSGVEEALAQLQLEPIPSVADSIEFRTVSDDFQALRALARYHASKCRATGNLALFYESGERRYLDDAEAQAESAERRWEELCARTEPYHDKLHFGPSGGHWRDNRPRVVYDLKRVRRVRELFEALGLFSLGFDFGQPLPERVPVALTDLRVISGLEPEPRFIGVNASTAYSAALGYGWLQTAGLLGVGFNKLPRELIWGVHYITPDSEYDPAGIEAMPLDGITERYLTATLPRTFRVDLPNGEHQVSLIAPGDCRLGASVLIEDGSGRPELAMPLGVGGGLGDIIRTDVTVTSGKLLLTAGGSGRWALAGLTIRPAGPMLAHLPPAGSRADQDLVLSATATSCQSIRTVNVRYRCGGDWKNREMDGDGTAFRAALPATDLSAPELEYALIVDDQAGLRAESGPHSVPIVNRYRPPRATEARVPDAWRTGEPLAVSLTLDDGEFAREIRAHYREADQNRDFKTATIPVSTSESHELLLDTEYLDDDFELLVYFELIDVFGRGTFYPDPFEQARYYVIKPAPRG